MNDAHPSAIIMHFLIDVFCRCPPTNRSVYTILAKYKIRKYVQGLMTYLSDPGLVVYYRKGRMHREGDLPAYYNKRHGICEWRLHGQLHREGDQPAVESSKRFEWWRHGQLHRDNDMPVYNEVDYTNEHGLYHYGAKGDTYFCYYQHGLYHREGDKPAVVSDSIELWFNRGLLHRVGRPAIVQLPHVQWFATRWVPMPDGGGWTSGWRMTNADVRLQSATEVWAVAGVLFRADDEPAVTFIRNGATTREWYIDGKLGRADDKPASCIQDCMKTELAWYTSGVKHRADDKPAVWTKYADRKESFEWFERGQRHRANDLPAYIDHSGYSWYWRGVLHREHDLPALIGSEGDYWYWHGLLHRDHDRPAVVGAPSDWFSTLAPEYLSVGRWGDPDVQTSNKYTLTGTVSCWFQYGKLHRENDLPAVVCGNAGQWYRRDKLHRRDLPALVCDRAQLWAVDGEIHRDDDLPARITEYAYEWWTHGVPSRREHALPVFISDLCVVWWLNGCYYSDKRQDVILKCREGTARADDTLDTRAYTMVHERCGLSDGDLIIRIGFI